MVSLLTLPPHPGPYFIVGIRVASDRLSGLIEFFSALSATHAAAFVVEVEAATAAKDEIISRLQQDLALPVTLAEIDPGLVLGEVRYRPNDDKASLHQDGWNRFWDIAQQARNDGHGDRVVAIALSPLTAADHAEMVAIRQAGGMALIANASTTPRALAQTLNTVIQCTVSPPSETLPESSSGTPAGEPRVAPDRSNEQALEEPLYPDAIAPLQHAIQESARTLQPWKLTWAIALPSGTVRWLQSQGQPTRQEDGTVIGNASLLDVSDRKRTESALREQEAYFRSLFDQASVGIAVCDRDGQLTRANQRYCDLVGYTEGELLGRSWNDVTVPADRAAYEQAMQALMQGETNYFALEKRYLHKDNSTRWVHVTCSAICDEQGQHNLTLGIVQDISERKRTPAALKLSEKRFRAIFQNTAMGIVIENAPDFRLSLVNPSYLQMLGYTSEELADFTYRDITVVEDLAQQNQFVDECFAGKRSSYQLEKRYRRKDGSQIWVNMVTSIVRNDSGSIEYFISVVEDITERKRAIDLEISRHQELKRAIFEESTDAIFLIEPDEQRIVDCNRRAIALFEANCKEDLLAREGSSLYRQPLNSPLKSTDAAVAEPSVYTEGIWHGEIEYLTDQGRRFWGYVSTKLIQVAEQQTLMVQITDISDRKQIELDMRRNMEELQRLNESKDDFLSTVSHELRSPLTSIDMAGRMIRIALEQERLLPPASGQPLMGKVEHYLNILKDQCNQERDLVNNLLDLQRLNADAYALNMTEIDLSQWLIALTDPIVERIQENHQQFELAIAPSLSTFITDVAVLRRILTELLHNACKYTPPQEHIQLTVKALPETLQLTVLNTGVAISPADQAQIFEPFFRATGGDRWSKRGTGLGLTLVKRFVTRLKGTIQVTSKSQTTCFIVQLPYSSSLTP